MAILKRRQREYDEEIKQVQRHLIELDREIKQKQITLGVFLSNRSGLMREWKKYIDVNDQDPKILTREIAIGERQNHVIERMEAEVRQFQQRLTTLINERMGKDDKVKQARVVKVIERIGEGEEAIQVVRVSLLEDPDHLMIRTVLGMVREGDVLTLLLPY